MAGTYDDSAGVAGLQIGWELPPYLPHKARSIFKELEWDGDEENNYCDRSLRGLRELAKSRTNLILYSPDGRKSYSPELRARKAEQFLVKRARRQIVSDLFLGNVSGQLQHMLPSRSIHLRSSSLNFLYGHAAEIYASPELRMVIRPAVKTIMQAGEMELEEYTSGRPERVGPYKNSFLLVKAASFLDPELARQFSEQLQERFSRFAGEFPVIRLFLPSVFRWAANPNEVSNADVSYLVIWPLDHDHPEWTNVSTHVAAYYGPEGLGSRLLCLRPKEAQEHIVRHADELRRTLIIETYRNCRVSRNDARTFTSFKKMHIAIAPVGGYQNLPRPLAVKVANIIRCARTAADRTDLPGNRRLKKIMDNLRGKDLKNYRISDKELETIRQIPY